jgi:predicted ABC-type ATPase
MLPLSGRSYLNLIRRLKKQGYAVHFFFLWLSGVDLALSRIEARVLQGGDDVPEADVRRRRSSWSCIVPWGIPGFSLTTHRERLLLLHWKSKVDFV